MGKIHENIACSGNKWRTSVSDRRFLMSDRQYNTEESARWPLHSAHTFYITKNRYFPPFLILFATFSAAQRSSLCNNSSVSMHITPAGTATMDYASSPCTMT